MADTGSLADWVAAIGTSVGSLGTVGTLIYVIRAQQREVRDRKEDLERIETARTIENAERRTRLLYRAALVLPEASFGSGRREQGITNVELRIHNGGSTPVLKVTAQLYMDYGGDQLSLMQPHATSVDFIAGGETVTVGFGQPSYGGSSPTYIAPWPPSADPHNGPRFTLGIEFTDFDGNRWSRLDARSPTLVREWRPYIEPGI